MNEPSLQLDDELDVKLTDAELELLTTDSGEPATKEAVQAAEQMLIIPDRRKLKVMTTGHKLRILQDLKETGSETLVCKKHRITKSVLAIIANDDSLGEVTDKVYVSQTKKLMASRFYQLADMALSHIDPGKLERLDPYKLGVLASIALDKARLIEGQSTENISFKSLAVNIHSTLDQLRERKKALLARLADVQPIETTGEILPT